MKKILGLTMALLVLCSLFVGCSIPATPAAPKKTVSADAAKTENTSTSTGEKQEINFLTWRAEDADVLKEMVGMFEAENPDVKVNLEITSSDITEYYTILKSRLVSNEGADVFHCHPGPYFDQLMQAGYLKDLTDTGLVALYDEDLLDVGYIGDELRGLLQTYNSFAIFYNTKIFDELGIKIPTTYAEVVEAAKKSRDGGYMPVVAGFAEAWTTGMVYEQLMANYAGGDDMIFHKLETGELKLTDEPFATVFKDIEQMAQDGIFQDNAMGTKYDASLSLFVRGEAAMLITGTWSVGGLKDMDETLEFGLFSLPGVSSEAVGILSPSQLICINDKTTKSDAAMKFIEFLSSKEGAAYYCNQTKQAPTVKDVTIDAPELAEVSKLLEGTTALLPDTYVKSSEMISITDEIAAKILGGVNVQQALEEGQKQIDVIVAEAKSDA